MQIFINGERQTIAPTSVLGYLESLAIDPQRVAVELNLDILPKGEYATTHLKDGDRIEIVHFVGGGQGNATFAQSRRCASGFLVRRSAATPPRHPSRALSLSQNSRFLN